MLFAHDKIRPEQDEMIDLVESSLKDKKFLLVHAPTGLGKTAAVLAPTLDFALKKEKTIFFLTSRHTQQNIIFETVQKINEKHGTDIQVTGIIGKKNMCAQNNVEKASVNDFAEYCKSLVADKACKFYENSKKKIVKEFIEKEVRNKKPDELIKICKTHYLCPYEISMQISKNAQVIVADYYYIFNSFIRQTFLTKIKKELKDAIIIIDEAHNLPSRLRKLWSNQISNKILFLALKEAKKYDQKDLFPVIQNLIEDLNKISDSLNGKFERLVKRSEIRIDDLDNIVDAFEKAAKIVLLDKKRTVFSSIAKFLSSWKQEIGYSRLLKKEGEFIFLKHNCIDPSLLTKEVFDETDSVIAMSGTLRPLEMYADVLGFPRDANKEEFSSPFPDDNRLAIVFPKTTTKFAKRSEQQYENIAIATANIANTIPGKTAIFFPSYYLRDSVLKYFKDLYENSIFLEQSGMSKEEKEKLLFKFKNNDKAVLLSVASGSFGEGIDLPGVLKGVLVVGLPLQKPDLETQQKIQYYEDKFQRGWDYGYVLPAMTTCFQNAGRCIRSEKDKGVLVFIDERFCWPMYAKAFPRDWKIELSVNPVELIEDFF